MTAEETLFAESKQALENADCLYDTEAVEQAINRMAEEISREIGHLHPLLLPVMIGGVVLAGKLTPLLNFPLQIDYIHATRYRSTTSGDDISWIKKPDKSLQDKTVLLIDDILDEGITLNAIIDFCYEAGANAVLTAVLADKRIDKKRALEKADFTGLTVPDRYVFGYGMDYQEYHRNLPGIYALNES